MIVVVTLRIRQLGNEFVEKLKLGIRLYHLSWEKSLEKAGKGKGKSVTSLNQKKKEYSTSVERTRNQRFFMGYGV